MRQNVLYASSQNPNLLKTDVYSMSREGRGLHTKPFDAFVQVMDSRVNVKSSVRCVDFRPRHGDEDLLLKPGLTQIMRNVELYIGNPKHGDPKIEVTLMKGIVAEMLPGKAEPLEIHCYVVSIGIRYNGRAIEFASKLPEENAEIFLRNGAFPPLDDGFLMTLTPYESTDSKRVNMHVELVPVEGRLSGNEANSLSGFTSSLWLNLDYAMSSLVNGVFH